MPMIFINYRTGDEEASATLIERELSNRFGSAKVFHAPKSVAPGDDIPTAIIEAVRDSKVLVAVIGPRWLKATDKYGQPALGSDRDWVRREIIEALDHGIRVVPVLVGDTPDLRKSDLPPELSRLPNCKYLRLNHRDAESGLTRLANELADLVPGLKDGRSTKAPATAGGVDRPSGVTGTTVQNVAKGNARVGIQAGDITGGVHFGNVFGNAQDMP